jgi:hypothetical protein
MSRTHQPNRPRDDTGRTWGKLTALRYVNHGRNGARWVCRCDGCGVEKIYPIRFVANGKRTCPCKTLGGANLSAESAPAVAWPFPRVVIDGVPTSPVWRTIGRR